MLGSYTRVMFVVSRPSSIIVPKELYERLKAEGKRSKAALIAVCNKLLKQAFAISTKGTKYQPDYKIALH